MEGHRDIWERESTSLDRWLVMRYLMITMSMYPDLQETVSTYQQTYLVQQDSV